jgi:SMC interacting uncharacterized protein involved in chromosome segregation
MEKVMEMKDLFNSLREQHEFLQTFLDTIVLQQKAIINNDIKGLEETIKTEGALLINIDRYEKQMAEIIGQLSDKYSIIAPTNKLTDFVNALQGKREFNPNNIVKLHSSLKKLVSQIKKINDQNRMLIEQARNFVKETVSALVNENHSPIFDRKA